MAFNDKGQNVVRGCVVRVGALDHRHPNVPHGLSPRGIVLRVLSPTTVEVLYPTVPNWPRNTLHVNDLTVIGHVKTVPTVLNGRIVKPKTKPSTPYTKAAAEMRRLLRQKERVDAGRLVLTPAQHEAMVHRMVMLDARLEHVPNVKPKRRAAQNEYNYYWYGGPLVAGGDPFVVGSEWTSRAKALAAAVKHVNKQREGWAVLVKKIPGGFRRLDTRVEWQGADWGAVVPSRRHR